MAGGGQPLTELPEMAKQVQPDRIQTGEFSVAFQQMCNFVAVAQFGKPAETVKGLIQLCFVLLDERFESHRDLIETIEILFGVRIPDLQMETAVKQLLSADILRRPAGSNLTLDPDARADMNARIQGSRTLEASVREKWLNQVDDEFPSLDHSCSWDALQDYLQDAFRRHGIQTVALFDPGVDTPPDAEQSLTALLRKAVSEHFEKPQHDAAERAVSGFLAEVGSDPERSRYITQLADGAFNFYSLAVSPTVAAEFRRNLNPLTLFLDTNFLFGILDLHSNSQVGISHELIRVIHKYNLPFNLRFHQRTHQEFRHAIGTHAERLRSRPWSRGLSRAAADSRNLTGVEQKFHERNAAQGIDVQEFLRPYEHADELLKQKAIKIFRTDENRLEQRVELHHDYVDFLKANRKPEKAYETIDHDVTVLDAVRRQRSNARSTLDAGALLITCDYWLFRFDTESSRRSGTPRSVLLPNVFWQVLRPYVPADGDFDKAFAETFALPEFRAIASASSAACSKMLGILATYKDVPEQTAAKLLSNGMLLDKLNATSDDKEFEALVEAAFVEDNATLLEEKAALESQLEAAKKEISEKNEQAQQHQAEIQNAANGLMEERARAESAESEAERARKAVEAATAQAKQEGEARLRAESRARVFSGITGVAVAVLLIAVFEIVTYWWPWEWMTSHPNSYGLQLAASLIILGIVMSIFYKRHAKWWLIAVVLAVIVGLIGILGGPSQSAEESNEHGPNVNGAHESLHTSVS